MHVLGFVPRADLPALYAGAACLVFPSLFEGFGIPLVEAMLVGCPIAASNATSIPEVVGDAAILFDPRDPADIARAIAAIVRDPTTAAGAGPSRPRTSRALLRLEDGGPDDRAARAGAPRRPVRAGAPRAAS